MKGLVLSGGKGTRLRPFTFTAAKQLVPIANKPVLFFVLEDLVSAGIRDIGIIVGDTADQIRASVGDGSRFGAQVTYIPQHEPLGLAHAVLTAERWLDGQPFVMYLGDNFLRDGIGALVRHYRASGANAQILLKHVAHPEQFGVAVIERDRVVRLVEKPLPPAAGGAPISSLALVGVYMFDHTIMDAARAITPSHRGELEITDAIAWLVDNGLTVTPTILDGWWIDTGKTDDLLAANRLVLEQMATRVDGTIDTASRLNGPVEIGFGARIVDSDLHGPLSIAAGTVVENCRIGPFTAIGEQCVIRHCDIQNSILMERCVIQGIDVPIENSIFGRYSSLTRVAQRSEACNFMLGDYSSAILR